MNWSHVESQTSSPELYLALQIAKAQRLQQVLMGCAFSASATASMMFIFTRQLFVATLLGILGLALFGARQMSLRSLTVLLRKHTETSSAEKTALTP